MNLCSDTLFSGGCDGRAALHSSNTFAARTPCSASIQPDPDLQRAVRALVRCGSIRWEAEAFWYNNSKELI